MCAQRLAIAVCTLACAATAAAQDAQALYDRALAANCSHCHGTDGRPVDGRMPRLAGLPRDVLRATLEAFRAGDRPATVMTQIARGYTPAQLDAIARWFAAQR